MTGQWPLVDPSHSGARKEGRFIWNVVKFVPLKIAHSMDGLMDMSDFHEDLGRKHVVEGSSDRAFGLTVGVILVLIGGVRSVLSQPGWLEIVLCIAGAMLLTLAIAQPRILAPLNKAWTKLGLFLFKVVNPVVLGLMFFIAVAPTGLIMRLLGKDILRLKFDPKAESYWIERNPPGPAPDTMRRQF